MTVQEPSPLALLRLRVTADDDPSVLPRLLGVFQNLNLTPRRVMAEYAISAVVHMQVDIFGLTEARLSQIAAKINDYPAVLDVHWHRL